MQDKKDQLKPDMEQQTSFRLGKEQSRPCHPTYLTSCKCWAHKLESRLTNWNQDSQTGIKIGGRNINNLRYADDTILMAESEEELKSLLMRMNEERKKLA